MLLRVKCLLVDSVLLNRLTCCVAGVLGQIELVEGSGSDLCGEGRRLRTADTLPAPISDSSLASSLQAQP